MNLRRSIQGLVYSLLLLYPALGQAQEVILPELLPRELEIELALSALPKHLRAEAAVYALERGGYIKTRDGANGFICLVRRAGAVPGAFYDAILPVCYDAEGAKTLLAAVLDEVKLLEQGRSHQDVAAMIEQGWSEGKYTIPGPGVSYMLSPIFCLNDACGGYVPHTMFYGPYKTDADVGASEDRFDHVPFIQAPGRASAMMVIPAGEKERALILKQEQELIVKVQNYLGQ